MKSKVKYIIIALIIILLIIVSIIAYKIISNKNKETVPAVANKAEDDVLVIGIDKKNQEQNNVTGEKQQETKEPEPEPEPEPEKDASTLTQDIYNMNASIGTIYIPKTKIRLEVYSSTDVKKMEKMPAFLYTSGGLNQPGITLLVGHNKRNGKIFSNNKKLSEGDVFYFTDYEGNEKEYTIYSKFTTTSDDTAFLNGDYTSPTMALSCCTDASDDNRIIILGRAE